MMAPIPTCQPEPSPGGLLGHSRLDCVHVDRGTQNPIERPEASCIKTDLGGRNAISTTGLRVTSEPGAFRSALATALGTSAGESLASVAKRSSNR